MLRLYPLLIGWVLLFAGCAEQEEAAPSQESAPNIAEERAEEPPPADTSGTVVLVLGNSIAAGAGVPQEKAFPALVQEKVDSLGWDVEIVNAGLSGETSAGGLRRVPWLLRRPIDVLVLELGGNDGLRGISPDVTKANLQAIIDTTRSAYPEARIVIAGMQIPPNLGTDYTRRFREIYPALASRNEAELIPFVLENVGGVPSRMQADGIHPNEEGHRVVAENVWTVLKPVLRRLEETQERPLATAP